MDSARSQAMQVVERALTEHVELMVSLQFLGMLVPDALAPLKEIAAAVPTVERLAQVPAIPVSRQEIIEQQRQRRALIQERQGVALVGGRLVRDIPRAVEPDPFGGDRPIAHRVGGTGSLFAQWMEGQETWSPAVMGWADDDERAAGWEDGRYD